MREDQEQVDPAVVVEVADGQATRHPRDAPGRPGPAGDVDEPPAADADQELRRHLPLDYLVDVGDTAQSVSAAYRATLNAAIAPATLASEADPNPSAPVHFDRLSWFLPMWQTDIANLQSLYLDGGRDAENYMRMLANPSDEVTEQLFLMYEAAPASSASANLDTVLTDIYQPGNAAALAQLQDLFTSSETAYFSNAGSQSVQIENYSTFSDRGRPYLRDNMTPTGRAAYRAALVTLLAEAQTVQPNVGNTARVGDIITCIQAVIAQIDALGS